MKTVIITFLGLAILCLAAGYIHSAGERQPQTVRLTDPRPISPEGKAVSERKSAEDFCYVYHGGDPTWYVMDYVINYDLYKAYQDPEKECDNPYPFTIDSIHFLIGYRTQGYIYFQLDIETIDDTDPSCPIPGDLVAIFPTSEDAYYLELDTFLYMIDVPLDQPVTVNGPFFVGLYFVDIGYSSAVSLVTDDIPESCVSYNIWESDGTYYIDDCNDITYEDEAVFPGRIVLYTSGYLGGGSGGDTTVTDTTVTDTTVTWPVPAARILSPSSGGLYGTSMDLWADDAAGSAIIDYARFQQYYSTHWVDIGTDFSDDPQLRNGVDPSGSGDGLSYNWNTAYLSENDYSVRVIIADTLGRADTSDALTVTVDPTPPFPVAVDPIFGDRLCYSEQVEFSCTDQDLTYMSFALKNVPAQMNLSVPTIIQNLGGDTDGNAYDNNSITDGEYGDYCCGPAAAAMAVKYWFNRDDNYIFVMREGTTVLSDALLLDRLFETMKVADNNGTYDGDFIIGLNQYLLSHGDQFETHIDRSPTLEEYMAWLIDYDYAIMIGLEGEPGLWLTGAGYTGWADQNGYWTAYFADPVYGTTKTYRLWSDSDKLWLEYGYSWMEVDIMVGMAPYGWNDFGSNIALDMDESDGWGFYWDVSTLKEDSMYMLHATAIDNSGNEGHTSVLLRKDCQVTFTPGDVNYDNVVNPADLVYLINYMYKEGTEPPAGTEAGDINCDNSIDMADIVYLYKYIFSGGPEPCAHK